MKRFFTLLIFLTFVLEACGAGAGSDASQPSATEPPATLEAVIPDTGTLSTSEAIKHTVIPGDLPAEKANHAGDQDSSTLADKHRATGGDRFTFGRFERPFNANTMDVYYPNIDIQDFTVYVDDIFIYSSVIFKSLDTSSPKKSKYAMEFDLDLDGRGDVLVLADQPGSTDWTTDGVQAWVDSNHDVGGDTVINSDGTTPGDGFETKVFDQGTGNDPDIAWVRISPDDPNTINIAVKLSLFNGDTKYLVGFWAGTDVLNPALFDINDHFTHEQAGEAMVDFEVYYPIKSVSELDNTCRLNVGFTPNGNEPGMCSVPGAPDHSGSCSISCGFCQIVNLSNCSCMRDPSLQCSG